LRSAGHRSAHIRLAFYVSNRSTKGRARVNIGHLLTRPIGRPPNEVRRSYANFTYQAGSWSKPRRVIAKVEWHPGELYPRVGFIVTNMSRATENVVAFYNKRGTSEQWIKEFSTTKAFPTEAKSRSGSKRPAPG
jgi:Transposase DDE domain group 1